MKNPWDKLANEPKNAHNAFMTYLDMDPRDRTLIGAYRLHSNNPNARIVTPEWTKWRDTHDWIGRADAYDADILRERMRARREGIKIEELKRGEYLAGGWRKLDEIGELALDVVKEKLEQIQSGEIEANPTQIVALLGRTTDIYRVRLDVQKSLDKHDKADEEKDDELDTEIEKLLGSATGDEGGNGTGPA